MGVFLTGNPVAGLVDLAAFFHVFKAHPMWRRLIILINLGGIAYGFYYYQPQFATTPAHLWPFVPDSPLAVLWATVPLVLYEFNRRRSAMLDSLAFVANVQVGLWTAYILLYYEPWFGTYSLNLNTLLLVLHLAMAVEALIFVHDLRLDFRQGWGRVAAVLTPVFAWVMLNDWLDYFYAGINNRGCAGLRPYTVPCVDLGLTAAVTFGISVLVFAWLAFLTRPRTIPSSSTARASSPER